MRNTKTGLDRVKEKHQFNAAEAGRALQIHDGSNPPDNTIFSSWLDLQFKILYKV